MALRILLCTVCVGSLSTVQDYPDSYFRRVEFLIIWWSAAVMRLKFLLHTTGPLAPGPPSDPPGPFGDKTTQSVRFHEMLCQSFVWYQRGTAVFSRCRCSVRFSLCSSPGLKGYVLCTCAVEPNEIVKTQNMPSGKTSSYSQYAAFGATIELTLSMFCEFSE